MTWQNFITVDPLVCHGKACHGGTRIMVSTVLDNLAVGLSHEDIIESYPLLNKKLVQAAISYTVELSKARLDR